MPLYATLYSAANKKDNSLAENHQQSGFQANQQPHRSRNSVRHQRQQQAGLSLTGSLEAQAQAVAMEQEAERLRELKGYEASYQYQPRSVLIDAATGATIISDPQAAAAAAASGALPGGVLDRGGSGCQPPPGANSTATAAGIVPGADKRSCSEWRMTLFVFYWIIWIVFLIGVVIIVAANARTA